MSYEDTIKKWDEAAHSSQARGHIHPSGNIDDEAYELSGFQAARKVLRVLPPPSFLTILDFGCGDGRVLRHLAGRYHGALGFDTSPGMVTACQRNVPVATVSNSLTALTGEDVDAIFSFAVFIHHTHDSGKTMLKQLAHLFPNAVLALQIPLYETAREPMNWTDVGVWTLPMLESAAEGAGLVVERAFVSPGHFSYDRIGHSHNELQVLRRKS